MKRLQNAKRIVKPLDPERAFAEALEAHEARHRELRKAAAGVLYVRLKLEGDVIELRAEIARLHSVIRSTVSAGNETRALALISEKQRMMALLERSEVDLAEIKSEADQAAAEVVASADERRNLQREKLRAIAAISVARARKRAAELRNHDEAPARGLEEVRAEVARLEGESHLDRELGTAAITRELDDGLTVLDEDRAKAELARIRASMKSLRCA